MLNKLLDRQVKKHFGDEKLPKKFEDFLKIISAAYDHNNQDRILLERSIEISSEEMLELNAQLREENEQRKKIAEEKNSLLEVIKKSEEKFRSFFDRARDPIFLLNENQQFIDCNTAALKILGATDKSQIINKLPKDFSPELQPDGQLSSEKSKTLCKNAFANNSSQFEWMHQRIDGSLFPVDVSLSVIPIEGRNLLLVHWRDITEHKMAEQKLNDQNYELQKANQALDRFAYCVSHDLRAPLSSMLGIVQLTEDECENTPIKDNLALLKGSILKLDAFIQDILAYSRNTRLAVRQDEIDFNELLSDVTNNLKYMEGGKNNVNLITNVFQEMSFRSDNNRLNIVLNNLVSNAIRYRNPIESEPFVRVAVEIDNNKAQITVEDNGIGIRKDLHEKVFDMFYRVSENSVGTGLGLYIVKETISKLNGSIAVESEVGVGTKFLITIPNL